MANYRKIIGVLESLLNQLIGSLKFNYPIEFLASLGALGNVRFNFNNIQNVCFKENML
jgi:hypothetical protein